MNRKQRSDRQIESTKKRITDAFVRLLDDNLFEHVSVTDICRKAYTSRITFYTYYSDKYDLLESCFDEVKKTAKGDFLRLQQENNPADHPVTGWSNLLKSILDLRTFFPRFLSHADQNKDLYLYSCYRSEILDSVEAFTRKYCRVLKPKYSVHQTSSLLCNGLWAFVNEGRARGCPEARIRSEADDSLRIMLASGLFG
jgi:AcrR family transcriptional regulator